MEQQRLDGVFPRCGCKGKLPRLGSILNAISDELGEQQQRPDSREHFRKLESPCSTCLHVFVRNWLSNVLRMWFARGLALWNEICHAHCKSGTCGIASLCQPFLHLKRHEFTTAQQFDPVQPPHLVTNVSTSSMPLRFHTRVFPWCSWMPACRINASVRRSNNNLTLSSSHRRCASSRNATAIHRHPRTLTPLRGRPECQWKRTMASKGHLARPLPLATLS